MLCGRGFTRVTRIFHEIPRAQKGCEIGRIDGASFPRGRGVAPFGRATPDTGVEEI